MESPHYFLKNLGLESFIPEPLPREDVDNFELSSKMKSDENEKQTKEGICEKQDGIGDGYSQITADVQADDFFSSLELQSSSKTTANVIGLNISNRLTGGIVTRSRSFSSTLHEVARAAEKVVTKASAKGRPRKGRTKKTSEKLHLKRRVKRRRKGRKVQGGKKPSSEGKISGSTDSKKQISSKSDESVLEKSLGLEKSKEDDDWLCFNNLSSKKEEMLESKQTISSELQNPTRRCTPKLFPMNSVLISDDIPQGKDDVDNLLQDEDYDDSFLEEMDEFNDAPPRTHTGGKWKPGSLTIRTSPMLWQNHTWDSILDDRNQEEERRHRSDTPSGSPTDSLNKYSMATTGGKWKPSAPPSSHTGGKWKPSAPPAAHTGGKWRPLTPPASHTGGKWKPSDFGHRSKNVMSPTESDSSWKDESERGAEPPPTHTGGKWKPTSSHGSELWKGETASKPEIPSPSHTSGKWGAGDRKSTVSRSTLDVLAQCQSTSGKCLKTSGGTIQYYCSPCNRRLSSKKLYKKHVQSELHFKRVLQENELEFDSRSLKLFHGLFTQSGSRERGQGKRAIKKPEAFKEPPKKEKKSPILVKIKGKRVGRREIIRCEVCRVKIPGYQLGKHLVSYYHSRRIQLSDPEHQKLILDNIHAIVKQAPYQCGPCKFYCNTHGLFKKHWALPVHEEMQSSDHRFWCVLCSFECETSRSMELHLDSNSHREVILAVNKSIPIIIRHKALFNCEVCPKEFRFSRELIHHRKVSHNLADAEKNKFICPVCKQICKTIKSLQRHILNAHKGNAKVPYFCSTCSEFFNSAEDAKNHRNSQFHKYKKMLSEGVDPEKLTMSRPCSYCEETLEDIATLKIHLLDCHFEFLPKCVKCETVFALPQELSQHVKSKECLFGIREIPRVYTYNCEHCAFATNFKSEIIVHMVTHRKPVEEEKKISCPKCKSLFTQNSLTIHLRTHKKKKTYQCSVCLEVFARKDRYVSHLKLKHVTKDCFESLEPPSKGSKGKDESRGKFRGTKSESEKKIKKKERRQICGDAKCKYVAKDLSDLESHSLFHIGPKIYQCPECPYSAKTNTIIKRHYMIHVDERSFPCHLCSFKARLKSHLKRHMRLHTGVKPYKCPHCPYTCNILENLRKHVLCTKIHPGKKLYECKLCEFNTNVSKDFKMHLFKTHKNDYRVTEANVVAGIYNREEDAKTSVTSAALKPRAPRQPPKKVYPAALKKKVDLLTQKFSPIAPKPSSPDKEMNLKNTGNSVEDKRKILKMELEKLKNQIKPTAEKSLRSYPSPAEKDLKTTSDQEEPERKKPEEKMPMDDAPPEGDSDSGVLLLNVMPAEFPAPEEPPTNVQQQLELSSACILYENVLPAEDMDLYLLENFEV